MWPPRRRPKGELTQALGRLFALTENYPQLKATTNVQQLQEELTGTENKVGLRAAALQRRGDPVQHQAVPVSDQPGRRAGPRRRRSCGRSTTPRSEPCRLWTWASGRPTARVTGTNLFDQQAQNRRRSALLIAGFVLFFAWIGFGGDLSWYLATEHLPPGHYHHVVPFTGILTSAIAGGIAWYSWRFGAERVLAATGAAELVEPGTPEEQRLVNVVEEMAIASGQPRPRIWIVPDDDPNAFATGRGPGTSHLAVTRGLLMALDRDELQGVVAHEMAHIRNLDVRLMTLLAAMVGTIALMSDRHPADVPLRLPWRTRQGRRAGILLPCSCSWRGSSR